MFLFPRDQLAAPSTRTPYVFASQVRFQEVDAAGIVFFSRIQEYFHDAYLAFLAHHGYPLHEVLEQKSWLAPIRHAEADYLKPLRFGSRFEVALVDAHLTDSEATLVFQLGTTAGLHAVGQTVHTFVDSATFRRCGIPVGLRAVMAELGDATGGLPRV